MPETHPVDLHDLNKLLEIWADCWAQSHGSKIGVISRKHFDWFDYTGKKFKQNSQLDPINHRLTLSRVFARYEGTERLIGNALPRVFKRSRTNTLEQTQTLTIEENLEVENTVHIQWTKALKLEAGLSLNIQLPIPPVAGIQAGLSAGISGALDFEKTTTQEIRKKIHFAADTCSIDCNPGYITEGRLTLTQEEYEQTFVQVIALSGYVVICCQHKVLCASSGESHRRWPVPINQVFQDLQEYAGSHPDQTIRQMLNKRLEHFIIQGDSVHFNCQGIVAFSKFGTQIDKLERPLKEATLDLAAIQHALVQHESIARSVERLFYPTPIPVESYFIHLSIVSDTAYQNSVRQLKKDESRDNYDKLFGHVGNVIQPEDILKQNRSDDLTSNTDQELIQKFLITGPAGIGKTILSRYLPYLWAQGKLNPSEDAWGKEYHWLFHISLRQLLNREKYPAPADGQQYSAVDILIKECIEPALQQQPTLLKQLETPIEQSFLRASLESALESPFQTESAATIPEHSAVLFILDGYDEVAEALPLYLIPTLKKLLAHSQVILTSRPYNLTNLTESSGYHFEPNRNLEVTGFTSENIREYIQKFFNTKPTHNKPKEADKLIAFIENNPGIEGTCRIPINLELVCTAWYDQPFGVAYLSISELYSHVACSLSVRYLERTQQMILKEMPNLTQASVFKRCQLPLGFLEYLGFYSFFKNTLFFRLDETLVYLRSRIPDTTLPSEINILQQQKEMGYIKPDLCQQGRFESFSHYYFNHLTFRDFFAARFIACILQQKTHPNYEIDQISWVSDFPHVCPIQDSMDIWLVEQLRKEEGEILAWFITGELVRVRDRETLRYFFNLLYDPSFDFIGYYRARLLIRCIDEIGSFLNTVFSGEEQESFLSYLSLASFNPLHPIFSHNPFPAVSKEKPMWFLWQSWRLSPRLIRHSALISHLKNQLPIMQKTSLFRFTEWLVGFNDPEHPLLEPLLQILGKQSIQNIHNNINKEPLLLKWAYRVLGSWIHKSPI